jgi:hypothetical protein
MATKKRKSSAAAAACAALLAALLLPAFPASAEPGKDAPYALLFGTVFDASDRPVYGAQVRIRRSDQKKPKWQASSDHSGEFAQRVPAGAADYVISAEMKEGKVTHKAEVTVHVDNDERRDFSLHLKE